MKKQRSLTQTAEFKEYHEELFGKPSPVDNALEIESVNMFIETGVRLCVKDHTLASTEALEARIWFESKQIAEILRICTVYNLIPKLGEQTVNVMHDTQEEIASELLVQI